MILLLAGTGEGRRAAAALEKEGHAVICSTATAYGAEMLAGEFHGEIISRPLDYSEMLKLIGAKNIEKVIDATHPFAEEVSQNAREACRQQGIAYECLEREAETIAGGDGVIKARDLKEAVHLAASTTGNIFLATGSSKLEHYTAVLAPESLVVRILPVKASLDKCLHLGIPPKNIIAMQGPFDEELNRLLFRRYNASLVITKESGPSGGTGEKVEAARSLEIPVILIGRPKMAGSGD